jgi:hypothetical protein
MTLFNDVFSTDLARTVQWKYSKAWCSTLLVVAMAATQLLSSAAE